MDDILTIKDNNNQEKEYHIIFTFISRKDNKKYVTYTDYSHDEEGNINCWSSYFDKGKLMPVTQEEELKVIHTMLETITESVKEKYKITSE